MNTGIDPTAVNVERFLSQSLFSALPPGEMRGLAGQAKVERFNELTRLNSVGETLKWLWLVIEGGINITLQNSSGKEVLISSVGPGAWVAWIPCFVPEPMATDYSATPGSLFIALPVDVVRSCFNSHPLLFPLMLKDIGKRMRLLIEWTGQSALLEPEQRLARLLSLLARDRGVVANHCELKVTQSHLAAVIGCSRQSIIKLASKLGGRGLIRLSYGRCEILDLKALKGFSEQIKSD